MLSDCPVELVSELPDGQHLVRCPKCGFERGIPCSPENYHRQCPKGSNPPAAVPAAPLATENQPPAEGVGTEFMKLAQSLGFTACQLCRETADKMNREGLDWCRSHTAELVAEIKGNFEKIANGAAGQLEALGDKNACQRGRLAGLLAKAKMLTGATLHAGVNLACGEFVPSPLHELGPIGSMLEEACRRAE